MTPPASTASPDQISVAMKCRERQVPSPFGMVLLAGADHRVDLGLGQD